MIIQKLKKAQGFSETEIVIADYILKNGNDIKNMSIKQLAEKTYSSPATIVRLCQKIGIKGYLEFRIKFNAEYEEELRFVNEVNYNMPFNKDDSYEVIVNNLANISIKSIQEASNNFNYEEFKLIVAKINEYKIINIFGEGQSIIVALDFQTKMLRLGRKVIIHQDWTNQRAIAVTSDADTCNILISHSGTTNRVNEILDILKENNSYCVAITSDENSRLAMLSDDCIHTGIGEDHTLVSKMEIFTSYTATHFVLDCLYCFLCLDDYDDNVKKLSSNARKLIKY